VLVASHDPELVAQAAVVIHPAPFERASIENEG